MTPMEKIRPKIRLVNTVAWIRKRYPKITSESIRFAAMVFYPVALVEVVAREKSVENFDAVQLIILRFIGLGLGRSEIAVLTGLTPMYIAQVEELLCGYGQFVPGVGVTNLGWESIKLSLDKGKPLKVEDKESRRHIQLDALSLSVIPYEKSVDETTFYEKSLARGSRYYQVGAIGYPEGIDSDALEKQLMEMDFGKLEGMKGVHVNIVYVSEMRCLKLRYSIACMLCLDGLEAPVVFGRRRGQEKSSNVWIPFGAEAKACQHYGFDDVCITDMGDNVRQLVAMKARFDAKWEASLKEAVRGPKPKESDHEAFKKWNAPFSAKERSEVESKALVDATLDYYSFAKPSCRWKYQRQGGTLMVDSGAFTDLRRIPAMAQILSGFAADGVFRLTTEKMLGRIVTVCPMQGDPLLQEVIGLLREILKRDKGSALDKFLQKSFGEGAEVQVETGSTLLNSLKQVLVTFLAETSLREKDERYN